MVDMGRKSSITRLPKNVRKELDKKLMEGMLTLDQLQAFLASCDGVEKPPSRSALGRYAKTFDDTAKKLRESREAARALAQELGPESVEGEQGRLLVEMLRGLTFDLLYDLQNNPSAHTDVEKLQRLSRTLKEMSHAMHLEQDFAKRIREEERRKVEEEMRAKVKQLGTAKDLKKLTDEELEKKISDLAARPA